MCRLRPIVVSGLLIAALSVAGRDRSSQDPSRVNGPREVPGGNAQQGSQLIAKLGCGTCHTIPGISNARGMVGPPLDHIADRMIIAGILSNTPEHMTAWLEAPQSIVPGNAMPNMGLKFNEARNVAAYLYTLH